MNPILLALSGGLVLDLLVGEPRNGLHPVAWFGRLVDAVHRPSRLPRLVGGIVATGLSLGAAATAGGLVALAVDSNPLLGTVVGALVVATTTSVRTLLVTVHRVSSMAERDLPAARRELAALAGRDASDLDADRVRSAALESLAENLADAVVAPLFAFAVGVVIGRGAGASTAVALGLACGCAVWIKAVDTMDSMVGYRDRSWGTVAARLDDAAMVLPARIAAVLIAVAFGRPAAVVRARTVAAEVTSPNSGWPMGTLAVAMGVRLAKPGYYDLVPTAPWPTATDAHVALGRVGLAALAAYGLAGVVGWS